MTMLKLQHLILRCSFWKVQEQSIRSALELRTAAAPGELCPGPDTEEGGKKTKTKTEKKKGKPA